MNQFKTLKKSENFYINLVNGKTFSRLDLVFYWFLLYMKHLLQKEKKMYFLLVVFVNFLVMLLFLVIILLQLWKVINIDA